jgi:DNA replication protein DnaC
LDCSAPNTGEAFNRKLKASGIMPTWATRYTFDTWDSTKNPHLMEAFRAVRGWADNPDGALLLLGPNGTGKTHLSIATAIVSAKAGWHVRYTEVEGLLTRMKLAMDTDDDSAQRVYESWGTSPDLLVLDDLGAEQHTEYSLSVVENLMSWRLMREKPTVVSNNTGFADYSGRLRSRMQDKGRVLAVTFDGADMRPQMGTR